MPIVQAAALRAFTQAIYEAQGVPAAEAALLTDHLVTSNLVGHDSHGVAQTPHYISRLERGHVLPGASPEIVQETPTTAVIDGHWGFGFTVTAEAADLAIEKARQSGVAALTVRHQGHIGRLSAYATRISAAGMIGMVTADSGLTPKSVAPYGGAEARLGTNPICFSVPSDLESPVFIDMATSAVAAGRISLAKSRGVSIPAGWIVDRNGQPSTDPDDLFNGGALLPLGGDQGHKGYGLGFIVEVLSGLLTGLGFGIDPQGRHNDGVFIVAVDVSRFRSLDDFKGDVRDFVAFLKETPLAAGHDEILYPGELEGRTARLRAEQGIPVDEATWSELTAIASSLGVPVPATGEDVR